MVMAALGIDKSAWKQFKRAFSTGDFRWYRFSIRVRMTAAMKRVLAGMYEPIIKRRNKRGYIIDYEIRTVENPMPLQCPPFYAGGIRITTKGLQLSLRRTDPAMAPKHDPEGLNRLLKPFAAV